MWPVDAVSLAAMLGDERGIRVRLHSLTPGFAIRHTWEAADWILTDVQVTSERTRTPRTTGSLDMANIGGLLSPRQPGDLFYTGELLRVEIGSAVNLGFAWVPLGTLVVTSATPQMDGSLSVECEDPTWLLQQQLGETITIGAGTAADVALRRLWEGYLPPGTTWQLDAGGRTVGTDRVWIESDNRLDAGLSLMSDLGLEVYADRLGSIILGPAQIRPAPPSWPCSTRCRGPGPSSTCRAPSTGWPTTASS